jgi:hypothetical protein
MVIQSALLSSDQVKKENCASSGICFFQVFSSTSSLLGLSRSSDYGAVNANLSALISFRRTFATNGQSNLWGQIAGTGLAGSGTGAAGRHAVDPMAGEDAAVPDANIAEPLPGAKDDYPPEFYQRDPARADIVVAHREATTPTEVVHKLTLANAETEGFQAIKGLQVNVKTKEKDDKVLLVCNLPTSTKEQHDGQCWTLKRGNYLVGPQFLTWTHELGRIENVLLPWLDEPGKARLDLDYTVNCRLKAGVQVSAQSESRHLTALVIPGGQVTSARSHEPMPVEPGRWYDVPGLQQISVTNPGEKVLVVCTMKYTAMWADEGTRGRFTILRDGTGLDPESYGLQSVRSMQRNTKRTAVMALVDDPQPGPHIYMARAAVTTGEEGETRVLHLDEDDRQLALIRLPEAMVAGPSRCNGAATVTEDRWTEIPGLSVTITVQGSYDKVMVVYNTNFDPADFHYEAYFTVFRTRQQGSSKNLGSEEQGNSSVASSSVSSSEFPTGMFVDSPGAGTFTYSVYARTRRCDHLTEPTEIEVGPDGQIAAVLLSGRQGQGAAGISTLEQVAKEMEEAQVP